MRVFIVMLYNEEAYGNTNISVRGVGLVRCFGLVTFKFQDLTASFISVFLPINSANHLESSLLNSEIKSERGIEEFIEERFVCQKLETNLSYNKFSQSDRFFRKKILRRLAKQELPV